MTQADLFFAAWRALSADAPVWGFVQDAQAGVLVLAVDARVAESVLAWELSGVAP